mmetsp:Transcript_3515/g.8241  ORF Transcript_3515/g.8241 Transcript_3515/m.8241 type:complete len:398 (-) Transcript_3515:187-1380(-)
MESAAPGVAEEGAGGAGPSLAGLLGVGGDDLDDLKVPAQTFSVVKKRPKLTHSHFFDDDRGFKKVLETFPKIKLRGKGHEFDDAALLLRHYEKWFQDLFPHGDNLEDLVWTTRNLLQNKERDEEGNVSDPREKLHLLRFKYKQGTSSTGNRTPGSAGECGGPQLTDTMKRRIEANRQRALDLKRRREEGGVTPGRSSLDSEALRRIAENKARALELRRQREEAARNSSTVNEEDILGLGEELDEVMGSNFGHRATQADQDEEDPFGFGGGFDDDGGSGGGFRSMSTMPAPTRAESSRPTAGTVREGTGTLQLEEDEDVFGFGGGFDDDGGGFGHSTASASKAPAPPAPPATSAPPAASPAAAAPTAAWASTAIDGSTTLAGEDEEDVFGFGGGFDDE